MDNIREQNDTLLKRITEILFFFTEKVRWIGRANDDLIILIIIVIFILSPRLCFNLYIQV